MKNENYYYKSYACFEVQPMHEWVHEFYLSYLEFFLDVLLSEKHAGYILTLSLWLLKLFPFISNCLGHFRSHPCPPSLSGFLGRAGPRTLPARSVSVSELTKVRQARARAKVRHKPAQDRAHPSLVGDWNYLFRELKQVSDHHYSSITKLHIGGVKVYVTLYGFFRDI